MPGAAVSPVPAQPPDPPPPPTGGPTLGALADKYEARSARASENVRYLAAAGIAIAWVLSGQSVPDLTRDLLCTIVLCVLALIFDFFHYVVAAFLLGRRKEKYEREKKVRQDFITVPKWMTKTISVFYWIKIVLVVLAFVPLVSNFVGRLRSAPASAPAASANAVARSAPLVCSEGDATEGPKTVTPFVTPLQQGKEKPL